MDSKRVCEIYESYLISLQVDSMEVRLFLFLFHLLRLLKNYLELHYYILGKICPKGLLTLNI